MPTLESNLLYVTAQQMILRRAGTPGRAPWIWRAVVITMAAASSFYTTPLSAQSVQVRIGAFVASPLLKDALSSLAVDTTIKGTRSDGITIKQSVSPIATVALRIPMRTRTSLELSGSVARSQLKGSDGLQNWNAGNLTIANAGLSLGYLYRTSLTLHGGVGFTRFFAPDIGMFSRKNPIRPMLEGGVSAPINVAKHAIEIDVRAQSHAFGIGEAGSSDGNVTRIVAQVGTTLWKAGTK